MIITHTMASEIEFLKTQIEFMRREIDDIKDELIKLKSKSPRKHSFEKSEWFDADKFFIYLLGKGWRESEINHYYESAKRYSSANGAKYLNWIEAVQNWKAKDDKKATTQGQSKFDKINNAI